MKRLSEKHIKQKAENDLRLLPLGIAALVCFIVAVSSGTVFWYFFSSKSPYKKFAATVNISSKPPIVPEVVANNDAAYISETSSLSSDSSVGGNNQLAPIGPETTPDSTTSIESEPATIPAPAGELLVEGGEIVLGGNGSKLPLRREYVNPFGIAETEVTNAQFREFVEATKTKFKLPVGRDDEPVTNVSWKNAKDYCDWLSQKTGAEVRLPTEAEWELAARGKDGWKYPWGNEWKDENAACKENNGKVKPVKSYPNGKSPFGAYDMVGNVWEWTADAGRDEFGKIAKYKGGDSAYTNQIIYIIKGGGAIEAKINNSAQSRFSMPLNFSSPDIGFRYVVIRKKPSQNGDNTQ